MELDGIIDELLDSYGKYSEISKIDTASQPSKEMILDILAKLQDIVFPGFFGRKDLTSETIKYYLGDQIQIINNDLKEQILLALEYGEAYKYKTINEKKEIANHLTFEFLKTLPKIREYLATDVEATFDGDPAAFSKSEIVLSYPGFYAIMVNRLAHELYLLNVPLIPRIMTEYAHNLTGIDIHPGATLGKYLMIDHGTGIVIGETTVIGEHVKIYQGVTLGALSLEGGQDLKNMKRHPTIEDNVTIYSNASILGGETIIGENATIGGSTFITKSVPARTTVNIKAELKFKLSEECQDF
jgi:serine O-acetyltransferase